MSGLCTMYCVKCHASSCQTCPSNTWPCHDCSCRTCPCFLAMLDLVMTVLVMSVLATSVLVMTVVVIQFGSIMPCKSILINFSLTCIFYAIRILLQSVYKCRSQVFIFKLKIETLEMKSFLLTNHPSPVFVQRTHRKPIGIVPVCLEP